MPEFKSDKVAKGGGTISFNINGNEASVYHVSLDKPVEGMKVIIPEYVQYNGRNYPVTAVESCKISVYEYKLITDKRRKDYGKWGETGKKHTSICQVLSDFLSIYDNKLKRSNSYVEEVVLPKTLKRIGDAAFASPCGDKNCLKKVNIPDGVEVIENRAFRGAKLTNVVIPSSVKSIDDYAFYCPDTALTLEIKNKEGKVKFGSNVVGSDDIVIYTVEKKGLLSFLKK